MSKHTPGPWEIQDESAWGPSGSPIRILGGIDGDADDEGRPRMIYTEICQLDDNKDELANARLIAASPDCLRELKHLVALLEPMELAGTLNVPGLATLNGARAAIAKAEGA